MKKMTTVLAAMLIVSTQVLADGNENHMMNSGHMNGQGNSAQGHMQKGEHMMGEDEHMMDDDDHHHDMRTVMGVGQINKIKIKQHMVNITHEPIMEMNWPKMRMSFQASEQVDLSGLKLGQKVNFILEVDEDNNYLIKEIKVME